MAETQKSLPYCSSSELAMRSNSTLFFTMKLTGTTNFLKECNKHDRASQYCTHSTPDNLAFSQHIAMEATGRT